MTDFKACQLCESSLCDPRTHAAERAQGASPTRREIASMTDTELAAHVDEVLNRVNIIGLSLEAIIQAYRELEELA